MSLPTSGPYPPPLCRQLILHYIYVFIGALHVKLLTRILLEIFIVFQPFEHGAVLLDTRTEMVALILQTPYAVLHLYDGDKITHGQHSRVHEYHSRNPEPYFLAYLSVNHRLK